MVVSMSLVVRGKPRTVKAEMKRGRVDGYLTIENRDGSKFNTHCLTTPELDRICDRIEAEARS